MNQTAPEAIAYKPLPATYRKGGFTYELLQRTERVALYLQTDPTNKALRYYEVCRVLRHNGRTIGESVMEPAEYLPSSEQWGQQAWTYKTLAAAQAKLAQQDAHLNA